MLPVFTVLIVAIKVIAAFSVLIILHEFGHFIVAKRSGVWVEEFGLGLPPRIFGKKIGETVYSLNWLPIGGFVKLHGETSSDEVVFPKRAFTKKKPLTRIAITLAGIVMNFILAIVSFAIIYFVLGIPGNTNIKIISVSQNSPAAAAGIQPNDLITKVNGTKVVTDTAFVAEISKFKGQKVDLTIERNKETLIDTIIPRLNPPVGEGALGVEFRVDEAIYFPPIWQRPFVSAWYGVKQTWDLSKAVVFGLGGAAQSVSKGQAPKGVVGPLGLIAIFKQFADLGLLPIINLIGVVSVNLAIVNLIPFPPLDGSRIALIVAEKLTKKKMTPKLEEKVYLIGFAVLIGLMILITSHEIPALIKSGSLTKYADTLLNQK